jgi:uridine kinase
LTVVIGICGGSGAGKTRLADALAAALPEVRRLAEDDYYRCASQIPDFDPALYNFDAPGAKDLDLLSEHLAALRKGRAIAHPRYDFRSHCRLEETAPLAPGRVVIVEGLHALGRPAAAALMDLKVFLDVPDDIRLARRILRDVGARGRDWRTVVQQYLETVRPMHERHVAPARAHADLVLDAVAFDPETLAGQVISAAAARGVALAG